MIVVTGTKRSGTSMWMQILRAGGLDFIGEEFPLDWGDRLRDLNPHGFFESRLRTGINFMTNPDPLTGQYLSPHDSRERAIKIFIPGVVSTDIAYLDRVIGTVRDWRSYARSRAALEATDVGENVPEEVRFASRYNMPAHIEWWLENYALLRDAMLRRYPFTMFSYESIVAAERDLITPTFDWLGVGDGKAAGRAVEPRQVLAEPTDVTLDSAIEATFDEFYRRVHEGAPIDDDFLAQLDDTHELLLPEITEHVHESHAAMLKLRAAAASRDHAI